MPAILIGIGLGIGIYALVAFFFSQPNSESENGQSPHTPSMDNQLTEKTAPMSGSPNSQGGGENKNKIQSYGTEFVAFIENHDRLFNVVSGALMVVFTIVLAIATVGLRTATTGLENWAKQQATDMKDSVAASQAASAAAQESAKAANAANVLNRDIFLSTVRPWVSFASEGFNGPLTYGEDGASVRLRFVLQNVGHSPAVGVHVEAEVFSALDEQVDLVTRMRQFCDRIKSAPTGRNFGYVLFPAAPPMTQDINLSISKEVVAKTSVKGSPQFLVPIVIGCIDYKFVFEDTHHQTGFIYTVQRSNRVRPEQPPNRAPTAIFPDEGDVPLADLQLMRFPLGFFAD